MLVRHDSSILNADDSVPSKVENVALPAEHGRSERGFREPVQVGVMHTGTTIDIGEQKAVEDRERSPLHQVEVLRLIGPIRFLSLPGSEFVKCMRPCPTKLYRRVMRRECGTSGREEQRGCDQVG